MWETPLYGNGGQGTPSLEESCRPARPPVLSVQQLASHWQTIVRVPPSHQAARTAPLRARSQTENVTEGMNRSRKRRSSHRRKTSNRRTSPRGSQYPSVIWKGSPQRGPAGLTRASTAHRCAQTAISGAEASLCRAPLHGYTQPNAC